MRVDARPSERVGGFESQIVQLRQEMRDECSATRSEIHSELEARARWPGGDDTRIGLIRRTAGGDDALPEMVSQ